jgi:peptidyl-prolyl cis-trans isomerase B (cyclophilin B)
LKIIIIFFIFSLILIPLTTNSFSQEVETRFTNDPIVTLETTHGNISIEFFPQDAPNHVQNFITLTNQGFYDGTLFHRVIPNFMIQGGDPNTIDGDPSTWGQGGPDTRIDAEFNSIKHNRGIVSMARSADVNSAGSQFFIVHANSNFLDGDYTAFGRIVTEESFETIDTISELSIGYRDVPQDEVKIIKASITSRLNTPNLLKLSEPERTESTITPPTGKQIFESKELNVSFSAPEGWLLQQPENIPGAPDVAVVGPKVDGTNPVISLTIQNVSEKTIDDLIKEKNDSLAESIYLNKLEILSQKKIKTNVYQIDAIGNFERNDEQLKIKFLEVMILSEQKSYTFAYSNTIENYDNEVSKFQESLNSFKILSQEKTIMKSSTEESSEEGGGCLIATAAYGSELAPQVQLLREIRDNQLMNTESGSAFMATFNDVYYSFSPIIADYERENPYFKEGIKIVITPMISTLQLMENAETESEVLGLGLSVISLNLGMYLGVPAIIIIGIKKRN